MSFPSDIAATWSLLQQLLEKALALPMADRLAWLERSADVPDSLREPLRRLLEVQAGIGTRGFVATFPSADTGLTPSAPVLIGDMVGPYRLLQELGDGGMGSVWLAERADGALKRKVALKLPRLAWASDLAGRMARERDILGALEHPNIARLYDAGLDQHGRPFLALEYVEGQRLDRYCDDNTLTLAERVRLFLQVLDAVQHAHINLVLHRDLKPANILVNQRGEIRLLDFGIAKLIADDAVSGAGELRSESLSRAMTPRFASPEQVQHSRLTLASDIYSLGVVLYEILTGTSPLITNNGSRAEYEIAIVDGRLRTPSRTRVDTDAALQRRSTPERVARTLRGDLDAVILKALARNATDRYASAEALRADLVRWLDGHPVRATPPSRVVSLKKFVARNAMAVGFSTAAIMAIVATAAIAILQAREAQLESRRATATRDFILSLFENANPELHGGREVSARELIENAEKVISENIKDDYSLAADIYSSVANIWARLGDKRKTREILEKRVKAAENGESTSILISALLDYAELLIQVNDVDGLGATINKLKVIENKKKFNSRDKASYLYLLGWRYLRTGRLNEADEQFDRAISHSLSTNQQQEMLRALYGKIRVNVAGGNRDLAGENIKKARIYLSKSNIDQRDKMYRELELASTLYSLGEYRMGLPIIDEIFKISHEVIGSFRQSQREIYIYWLNWGLHTGRISEGLEWFSDARNASSNSYGGTLELDFEFMLMEAEYRLAAGDLEGARNLIKSLESSEKRLSISDRKSLSLTKMQLNLLSNRPELVVIELNSSLWGAEPEDAVDDAWKVYEFWYRGIALYKAGDMASAIDAYRKAESLAVSEFGLGHPRRLLIAMNKLFVMLLIKKEKNLDGFSSDEYEELKNELSRLVGDLHLVIPDRSPLYEKINKCFISKIDPKNTILEVQKKTVYLTELRVVLLKNDFKNSKGE